MKLGVYGGTSMTSDLQRCFSLMSLTELALLNCSARRTEGWNPDELAVTARDTALNIFLPSCGVSG